MLGNATCSIKLELSVAFIHVCGFGFFFVVHIMDYVYGLVFFPGKIMSWKSNWTGAEQV